MYSFREAHFATWVQRIYHVNTHTWFPPQIVNIKCHKGQIQLLCFLDILWTMLIKKLRKIMNLNFLFLHGLKVITPEPLKVLNRTWRLLFPKHAKVKFHSKYWLTQLSSDCCLWIITDSIVRNTSYLNQN